MLTLDSLLARLQGRPDPTRLLADFVPPPRFSGKTFGSYQPAHTSQTTAAERLRRLAIELRTPPKTILLPWLHPRSHKRSHRGIYLDGGFGVGKTHLLAALWTEGPSPRAFLSFDELMYFIGLMGVGGAARAFAGYSFVAVDEWELDDPGNLTMALAFLRSVLAAGTFVAVTSNTLPLDLGGGRFSQKNFTAEIEEVAAAFEVVRISGEDYRRRNYASARGSVAAAAPDDRLGATLAAGAGVLDITFGDLMTSLGRVHPTRFRELSRPIEVLVLDAIAPISALPDALRFVHFVDGAYVGGMRIMSRTASDLGLLFPAQHLDGPYGKKLMRCRSRLEEMLG